MSDFENLAGLSDNGSSDIDGLCDDVDDAAAPAAPHPPQPAAVPVPIPQAQTEHQQRACFARRVLSAVHKREKRQRPENDEDLPRDIVSFHLHSDKHLRRQHSAGDVAEIVWGRCPTDPNRRACEAWDLRESQLKRILSTTLWRYLQHRGAAIAKALNHKRFS